MKRPAWKQPWSRRGSRRWKMIARAAMIAGVFVMGAAWDARALGEEPGSSGNRQPGQGPGAGARERAGGERARPEREGRERERMENRDGMGMMKPEQMRKSMVELRDRLEAAIKALDGGAKPEEVLEKFPLLRMAMRNLQAGRPGGAGPGGPGGGPGSGAGGGAGERGLHRGSLGHVTDPLEVIDAVIRFEAGESPRRIDRDLTISEKAELREFLDAASPPLAEDLARLEKLDSKAAGERYRSMYPRVEGALRIKKEDPELHGLMMKGLRVRHEATRLAKKIAQAGEEGEKEEAVKKMREELRGKIEEIMPLAEQIRSKAHDRRMAKDRQKVIDQLVKMAIDRERRRLEEPGERRGGLEDRDSDAPPSREPR